VVCAPQESFLSTVMTSSTTLKCLCLLSVLGPESQSSYPRVLRRRGCLAPIGFGAVRGYEKHAVCPDWCNPDAQNAEAGCIPVRRRPLLAAGLLCLFPPQCGYSGFTQSSRETISMPIRHYDLLWLNESTRPLFLAFLCSPGVRDKNRLTQGSRRSPLLFDGFSSFRPA
jgi:hypothetical protein